MGFYEKMTHIGGPYTLELTMDPTSEKLLQKELVVMRAVFERYGGGETMSETSE